MTADVVVGIGEGVENIDLVVQLVGRIVAQIAKAHIVLRIDLVVEGRRTQKDAVVLPLGFDVDRRANDGVGEVLLIEVQVAVIGVDAGHSTVAASATAIDHADLFAVALAGTHADAGRKGRVDRHIHVAEFVAFRMGSPAHEEC